MGIFKWKNSAKNNVVKSTISYIFANGASPKGPANWKNKKYPNT